MNSINGSATNSNEERESRSDVGCREKGNPGNSIPGALPALPQATVEKKAFGQTRGRASSRRLRLKANLAARVSPA
jgi:hypothetical protein